VIGVDMAGIGVFDAAGTGSTAIAGTTRQRLADRPLIILRSFIALPCAVTNNALVLERDPDVGECRGNYVSNNDNAI